MLELSISAEGLFGLNWSNWRPLATTVDELGFAGLYCSDHFQIPGDRANDSLDVTLALAWAADHTERVHFGQMVSPFSFRDPVILARQAMGLDNLSNGRMILGVGAGWMESEHEMFGYDLGDIPSRLDRFEEGLHVVSGLIRNPDPFSYDGQFYRLKEAVLRPKGNPKILVGAKGPKRSMPLVARYADIWNATGLSPTEFGRMSALLDDLLQAEGRPADAVKRTMTLPVLCGRNEEEMVQRWNGIGACFPGGETMSNQEIEASMRGISPSLIAGTPQEVITALQTYADAGAGEIMIQWFGLEDLAGLHLLAEHVMPYLE